MEYEIRRTKIEDLPQILDLIHEFHAESIDGFGIFCNDKIINELMPKLVDTSLVMEIDGQIKGVIAGFIADHIVNGDKFFHEVIWYVSKEYRKYGLKLLIEAENFCKEMGIKQIMMAHMGVDKENAFRKLYLAKGYTLLSVQYIKTLEG